jgi:hypothetical protein
LINNRRKEQKSALTVGIVLVAMAAWSAYRGRDGAIWVFGSLGLALIAAGLFLPAAARSFHAAWMRLAHALGWVNSRILLALLFYLVMTPMGLIQRLAGRDALRRRGQGASSYWIPRSSPKQSKEQFERLF